MTTRSTRGGVTLGLAGIALLAWTIGCKAVPPTRYYVLEPRAAAARDAGADGSVSGGLAVGVRAFRVDPPYDQDRIVYRVGAESPEVGFYEYHRWAAPLGRMLPTLVADALEGVPGIASIGPAQPGGSYSAWLRGRVVALEEVDLPEGERVRVRLVLSLAGPDGETLWSHRLSGEAAVQAGNVATVVERMRAVLEEQLTASRTGLAAAIARRSP